MSQVYDVPPVPHIPKLVIINDKSYNLIMIINNYCHHQYQQSDWHLTLGSKSGEIFPIS